MPLYDRSDQKALLQDEDEPRRWRGGDVRADEKVRLAAGKKRVETLPSDDGKLEKLDGQWQ